MLALLYLAMLFLFGLAFLSQLKLNLEGTEKLFLSLSFGILVGVPLTYVCALAFRELLPGVLLGSFLMLASVVFAAKVKRLDLTFSFDKAAVAFAFLAFLSMALLIRANLLDLNEKGEAVSGASSYGDVSIHAIVTNSFALTNNIPPQDPTFAGMPLGYHFLADFLSGIMTALGLNFRVAIQFGNIISATAFLVFLYALGLRLFGSRKAGVFAAFLVVFSGGLGFIEAYSNFGASGLSPTDFLSTIHTDYSYFDHAGGLANMFETGFCAARATIAGLAPALGGLLVLVIALKENREWLLLALGIIAGCLPLLQVHMFVAFFGFVGVSVLACKGLAWWRGLAAFCIIAALLAVPFLAPAATDYASSGSARINLGWQEETAKPLSESFGFNVTKYPSVSVSGNDYSLEGLDRFLSFWVKNLGVFGLLLIAGVLLASGFNRRIFLAALSVFALANVVQLLPYEFDNIKFMYFFLSVASLYAAYALQKLWERHAALIPVAVCLLLLSTATGALAVLFNLDTRYANYSPYDFEIGAWVAQNTPQKSVFLTSDFATHPVPNIAGRAILEGYRGWLWTRAINLTPRDEAVKVLYEGKDPAEVARLLGELKVDYVYIGASERGSQQFSVNESFFESSPLFEQVYENQKNWWDVVRIYRVKRA